MRPLVCCVAAGHRHRPLTRRGLFGHLMSGAWGSRRERRSRTRIALTIDNDRGGRPRLIPTSQPRMRVLLLLEPACAASPSSRVRYPSNPLGPQALSERQPPVAHGAHGSPVPLRQAFARARVALEPVAGARARPPDPASAARTVGYRRRAEGGGEVSLPQPAGSSGLNSARAGHGVVFYSSAGV